MLRAGVDVLLEIAATRVLHRVRGRVERREKVSLAMDPERREVAEARVGALRSRSRRSRSSEAPAALGRTAACFVAGLPRDRDGKLDVARLWPG